MTLLINGTGISRGISIGRVHHLQHGLADILPTKITQAQIPGEVKKFKHALQLSSNYLMTVRESIAQNLPDELAGFIDSHLLMLNDIHLKDAVIDIIKTQSCSADWALNIQKDYLMARFEQMQDEYLKARRDDIEQVVQLVHRYLLNADETLEVHKVDFRGCIIVTDNLTPADTIVLQNQHIAGFITEFGGLTSHTTILARSLSIPAIAAVHNARLLLQEGEEIILDGEAGMIIADADEKILHEYRKRKREIKKQKQDLYLLLDKPTVTQDGTPVLLMANLELSDEIKTFKKSGADGIGLYRTEFLYLNRKAADESEQFHIYRLLVKAAEGKPITIRTLDLGAEKDFDSNQEISVTANPVLGLRAIRRSLKDPHIFLHQLRAILRASAHGNIRIMFPMLTSFHEIKQLKQLVDIAKQQLRDKNNPFDNNIKLGAMVEVPAAALSAPRLCKHFDFLSIGTNDLIQYTLAIDRIDDEVSYLYDPLHPSVLKLIHIVIHAGKQNNVPVAMCGEMAGDTKYIKLLLGMGLREFSSHLSTLLEVKNVILNSDIQQLEKRCKRILNADPEKIPQLVRAL